MGWLVLARVVALGHLAFVLFLVLGGPLSLRWRRLLPAHLAVVAITVALNRTGMDCPLTTLEKDLLRSSDIEVYRHGFVEHYLVEPVHPTGNSPTVTFVLVAIWLVPTVISYALIFLTRSSHAHATISECSGSSSSPVSSRPQGSSPANHRPLRRTAARRG